MKRELTTPFSDLFDIMKRETLGFDRMLDDVAGVNSTLFRNENYPKYNIAEKADGTYIIEIAAAGFSKEEIDISHEGNSLIVKAKTVREEDSSTKYLRKDIASREFSLSVPIAPDSEVKHASFRDGIVYIEVEKPTKKDAKKIPLQ